MERSFYFLRHGETDWNAELRLQGSRDIPLNNNGIKQAEEAASILATHPITKIVSSDLMRARHTAEIVTKKLKVPLQLDARLREHTFGAIEGMTKAEIKALPRSYFTGIIQGNGHELAVGGEHWDDFNVRIENAIRDHLLTDVLASILFVSHSGVFRALNIKLWGENKRSKTANPYLFSGTKAALWELHDLTQS